jgi:hypothetical protein
MVGMRQQPLPIRKGPIVGQSPQSTSFVTVDDKVVYDADAVGLSLLQK